MGFAFVAAGLSCVGLAAAAVQHPAPGRVEFFVAPNGSDRGEGSAAKPFATPARAQRAVREALARNREQNVTVIVRAGTYELPEPLCSARKMPRLRTSQ
jgi:hypothetical protein